MILSNIKEAFFWKGGNGEGWVGTTIRHSTSTTRLLSYRVTSHFDTSVLGDSVATVPPRNRSSSHAGRSLSSKDANTLMLVGYCSCCAEYMRTIRPGFDIIPGHKAKSIL